MVLRKKSTVQIYTFKINPVLINNLKRSFVGSLKTISKSVSLSK